MFPPKHNGQLVAEQLRNHCLIDRAVDDDAARCRRGYLAIYRHRVEAVLDALQRRLHGNETSIDDRLPSVEAAQLFATQRHLDVGDQPGDGAETQNQRDVIHIAKVLDRRRLVKRDVASLPHLATVPSATPAALTLPHARDSNAIRCQSLLTQQPR